MKDLFPVLKKWNSHSISIQIRLKSAIFCRKILESAGSFQVNCVILNRDCTKNELVNKQKSKQTEKLLRTSTFPYKCNAEEQIMSFFGTGANSVPIGKKGGEEDLEQGLPSYASASSKTKTGCKKCGYPGHLTFECRNFVQLDPVKNVVLDVSSTSSDSDDEYLTPLTSLRTKELEKKRKDKKKKSKKSKKRKRRHSSGSDSDESEHKKKKKKKEKKERKKRKKEKKKRSRHSSSSSSTSS